MGTGAALEAAAAGSHSSCPSAPLGALTALRGLQSLTLWDPGTLTPHLGPVKTKGIERIWAGLSLHGPSHACSLSGAQVPRVPESPVLQSSWSTKADCEPVLGTQHSLVGWMGLGWDCHCCSWLCPWLYPGLHGCALWEQGGGGISLHGWEEEESLMRKRGSCKVEWVSWGPGKARSTFPSAVAAAVHQHAVKLGTCRTVQGNMWDRAPGFVSGAGGLWSLLADRLCNFGKGEREARLACLPHAGSLHAASPCCVPVLSHHSRRRSLALMSLTQRGLPGAPHGSVSPCHAAGDVCERGGSTALSASPTLPAPQERGCGNRRSASAHGTARDLPA